MTTMFVRHEVADFAKWKEGYDEFRPTREQMGVTAAAVYQAPDNPNDVTVTHEFATLSTAQTFVESDELRTAMEQAGVAGPPTIWFADKA
jgi:hypothetical protein